MNYEIAPHICLPEPSLSFHPDRPSDREVHPLHGLLRFGPYSAGYTARSHSSGYCNTRQCQQPALYLHQAPQREPHTERTKGLSAQMAGFSDLSSVYI